MRSFLDKSINVGFTSIFLFTSSVFAMECSSKDDHLLHASKTFKPLKVEERKALAKQHLEKDPEFTKKTEFITLYSFYERDRDLILQITASYPNAWWLETKIMRLDSQVRGLGLNKKMSFHQYAVIAYTWKKMLGDFFILHKSSYLKGAELEGKDLEVGPDLKSKADLKISNLEEPKGVLEFICIDNEFTNDYESEFNDLLNLGEYGLTKKELPHPFSYKPYDIILPHIYFEPEENIKKGLKVKIRWIGGKKMT